MKLAPEGYPFVGGSAVLALTALVALGPAWAAPLFVLCAFMVYFFRDPERQAPDAPGYLSPADGKIVLIKEEHEREHLDAPATKVSIFMSPMDVHVNRAPCGGKVLAVKHTRGGFRAAFKEEASFKNERTAMALACGDDKILVTQVAGFLARRTVCRVKPGDTLARGGRYGMIKFSSRLDLHLPPDVRVRVKVGDRVKAGMTVIAAREEGA
jgi:phosphatidylserine decarboxylase